MLLYRFHELTGYRPVQSPLFNRHVDRLDDNLNLDEYKLKKRQILPDKLPLKLFKSMVLLF